MVILYHVRTEGREQGQNVKAGEECMNTEYNQRVPGHLAIYHHFRVISPLFSFSTHLYDPEQPPPRARAFHFRILYRTPGVNIAPLVPEAIEIAPLSSTPAPLLGSGEILELGLF